jgi:hypothetical protein
MNKCKLCPFSARKTDESLGRVDAASKRGLLYYFNAVLFATLKCALNYIHKAYTLREFHFPLVCVSTVKYDTSFPLTVLLFVYYVGQFRLFAYLNKQPITVSSCVSI